MHFARTFKYTHIYAAQFELEDTNVLEDEIINSARFLAYSLGTFETFRDSLGTLKRALSPDPYLCSVYYDHST